MPKQPTEPLSDQSREVTAAIDEVLVLDRAGCLERWRQGFGRPPPKHLSLQFLQWVLIWKAQTRLFGGVAIQTERRLHQIAMAKSQSQIVRPGSHLIREWNGRTYQVEVIDDGYVMDGKTWRSLSALAKHITGAHWSGPRFFGVQ